MTSVLERWRDIPGWEGYYRVSDLGCVESVERIVPNGDKMMTVRQRFLRPLPNNNGYEQVQLYGDGKRSRQLVSRLVLLAFVGPCPEGMEVCHNDGDKRRNHLQNLRYGTSSENKLDMARHGTHHNTIKTHCKRGHPFDEANTYVNPRGNRDCRECKRKAKASFDARRRAKLAANNHRDTP